MAVYYFHEWYKDLKSTFRDGMRLIEDPFFGIGADNVSEYESITVSDIVLIAVTISKFENINSTDNISYRTNISISDTYTISDVYYTDPIYVLCSDNIVVSEYNVTTRAYTPYESIRATEYTLLGAGLPVSDTITIAEYTDRTVTLEPYDDIPILDIIILAIGYSSSSQYSDGTVIATNGSNIIEGYDVEWITNNISGGDLFQLTNEKVWYKIAGISEQESLTLVDNYYGEGSSDSPYVIHRSFTSRTLPLLAKYDDQWYELYNRAIRIIDKDINDLLEYLYYRYDPYVAELTTVSDICTFNIGEKVSGYESVTISENIDNYNNYRIGDLISITDIKNIALITV